ILLILSVLSSILLADDVTSIQFSGVEVTYKDKEMSIKRLRHPECLKVGITPYNIFGGNLAARAIPRECKRSIVTALGTTQPMKIDKEIETVGELEVLKFLAILEFEPDKYALIDARDPQWYEEMTIPNSINIPYAHMKKDENLSKEYTRTLKLLNIEIDKNGKLDFSLAKEVILFCNANWCVQSVWAVKSLVKMGYPKNKIFWYRGGLQDWAGSGFTTVKP
ncbi:MAG: rhodanese-like domain-containing protein, partial [Sulfurimonadaceae bacterium]